MKRVLIALAALLCLCLATLPAKDVHVKGYIRKDGTYVAPHVRTSPNTTKNDNYSTRGNVNPYTGKVGTRPRDAEPSVSARGTAAPSIESEKATIVRDENTRIVGWPALKSGMPESEVRRQLGQPAEVEGKESFEIWSYPTGMVFVKDGKVVAWKREKDR